MLSLVEIIDQIKRWGVHDIRRILHHESWTGRKERPPFHKGRPDKFEKKKSKDLVSFEELRRRFQELVNDKENKFDSTIERTHIRIARAFLLIDDNDRLNQLLEEDHEIDGSILNSYTFDITEYQIEMRRQLDELDTNREVRSGDISKTQLCYALECLLSNEKASIQKITWEGVKSKWGPKIVLNDGDGKYLYIYNSQSEKTDKCRVEKYNVAAKLGATDQYGSEYVIKDDVNPEFQKVLVISVRQTSNCDTLDVYFSKKILQQQQESLPTKKLEGLFKNVSKIFTNIEAQKRHEIFTIDSSAMRLTLPRLTKYPDHCIQNLLSQEREWKALRHIVVDENHEEYFVIHGDEWGGNFLVSEMMYVFVIDFEDALFAKNLDEDDDLKIETVGGDLSSRIFHEKKSEVKAKDWNEAGLNIFGSIGRLLTAIVQYPRDELLVANIEKIIKIYMKAVENTFKNSPQSTLASYSENHWEDFQKQILLFALDWALYWKRDGKKNKFEKMHFDEFVKVVRNLLNCSDIEKEDIDTAHDPPSPSESVYEYPEAGVEEAKELFDKAFKLQEERKIDDAYDTCYEAYTIVESSGNSSEKAFVSLWLGLIASWTEKSISVALNWLKDTVLVFQEQPDQVVVELSPRDENILLECYCHLVWVYWFMGEEYYDNAEDALRRWYALYWGEEDYSNTLTIEQILEQPYDVKKKDIEFHFDSIWQNAAKLYFSKQEFATAAAIYEALAKQETDERIADNWNISAGIAYSKNGDYEKAEGHQLLCLTNREKWYRQGSDECGDLVSKALRNLCQNAHAAKDQQKFNDYYVRWQKFIDETGRKWASNEEINNYKGFMLSLKNSIPDKKIVTSGQKTEVEMIIHSGNSDPSSWLESNMIEAIDIAEIERLNGEWSKSIKRLRQVIEASEKMKLFDICAKAYNDLGTCYFEQKKFPNAKQYYESAMDLYSQIENREREADVLMNLALIAAARKQYMDSDARFSKCLEIFKLVNNDRGIADVYTNRADIEIERGNIEIGREYIDVALGIFAKPSHKVDLWKHSTALNISANIYFIKKNFQKAIDELNLAMELFGAGPFEQKDKSDLYNNLGITHMAYAPSLRGSILEKFMDHHLEQSEHYFRLHLKAVSEMEESPSDWFLDNGFFEDSEHWTQFPPSTSPKWL